jgi:hypothetical protein
MSNQQWDRDNDDRSIIVIRERRVMWAVYFAFIIAVATLTFVVMELLFGGR